MLVRIAILSCLLAAARLFVVHGTELVLLTTGEATHSSEEQQSVPLFTASTFSQLLSSYFLVAGMIFSTVVGEYREAGKLLDEALATFAEFADSFRVYEIIVASKRTLPSLQEVASPALSTGSNSAVADEFDDEYRRVSSVLSQLDDLADTVASSGCSTNDKDNNTKNVSLHNHAVQLGYHLDKFMVVWAESLRLPLRGRHSCNGPWKKAQFHLNQSVASSAHLMVDESNDDNNDNNIHHSKSAATELNKTTLKCVDKLRRAALRIHNIRTTIVLAPAQIYVNLMLVVVLACVFFTEFFPQRKSATTTTTTATTMSLLGLLAAEAGCVACSSACALLIHALISAMDDPFTASAGSLHPASSSLWRAVAAAAWRAVVFVDRNKKSRRRRRRKRGIEDDNDGEDDDEDSNELLDTQISVAPLLKAVRKRHEQH